MPKCRISRQQDNEQLIHNKRPITNDISIYILYSYIDFSKLIPIATGTIMMTTKEEYLY